MTGGFIGLVNVGTSTLVLNVQDSTDPAADVVSLTVGAGSILIIGPDMLVIVDGTPPPNILLSLRKAPDGDYIENGSGQTITATDGNMTISKFGMDTIFPVTEFFENTSGTVDFPTVVVNTHQSNISVTNNFNTEVLQVPTGEFFIAQAGLVYIINVVVSNTPLTFGFVLDGTYTNPADGESYVVADGMMSYTDNGQTTSYFVAGISLPQVGYRGPDNVIFINRYGANLTMTSTEGTQVLEPLGFYLALNDIEYTFVA